MIIKFNLSYEADPEIAKWLNNADFRRALSLGIDRDQINETFWLGTGTPGSVVPGDANKYNPGPGVPEAVGDARRQEGQRAARQDRARQEGRRGLPAADRRQGPAAHRDHDARRPVRAVHADRRDDPRAVEEDRHRPRGAGGRAQPGVKRTAANEQQLGAWNNDGSEHLFTFPVHVFPFELADVAASGPLYASGSSPPARRARSRPRR